MSERPTPKCLAIAAGLAGALALLAWPAAAEVPQIDNCRGVGEAYLAQLGIDDKAVDLIEALPRYSVTGPDGDEQIIGYEIGARLVDCVGWVRIDTDAFCRIRQSYTQGGRQVEGLPHFD